MRRSETIQILDGIYGEKAFESISEEGWYSAWNDIKNSFIGSQIYHLLRTKGRLEEVPDWFVQELKHEAERILFQNMLIRVEQKKMLEAFEKFEIEVIPLKGTILAERFFGHFAARPTTDLDILVKENDIQRATDLLENLSFIKDQIPDNDHFHLVFNKSYENPLFPFLSVELHWNILRSHDSKTVMEPFWERSIAMNSQDYVKELNYEDSLYHICIHGFNHQMLSLKYIIDVAQLIVQSKGSFNFSSLFNKSKQDGNESKLIIVLTLVYKLFPSLNQIEPLPRKKHWPLWNEQLMREAGLGIKSKRYFLFRFVSLFVMYDSVFSMLKHLRFLVFPPKDYAQTQLRERKEGHLMVLYMRIYRNRLKHLFSSGAHKAGTKEYDI